jgi:HlyD family secretion protein
VQEFRNRLVQELKPSDAQKAQLEEIYSEARQRFARVRDLKGDGNRRREMEKVRSETNARIAEILTPEQKPAWERLLAEAGPRGQSVAGRVYLLEAGEPRAVDGRLGLTDGSTTEAVSGLAEGAEVIIGTAEARGAPGGASGGLPRARFF